MGWNRTASRCGAYPVILFEHFWSRAEFHSFVAITRGFETQPVDNERTGSVWYATAPTTRLTWHYFNCVPRLYLPVGGEPRVNAKLLQEAFSLLESDVSCWNDAARHYEYLAATLTGMKAAEYGLMAAVYHERSQLVSITVNALRPSLQSVRRNRPRRFRHVPS